MINVLTSGSSSPDSSLDQGHCVMFFGNTRSSCCLCHSPPRCINGYKQIKYKNYNLAMDCPFKGKYKYS